MSPIRLLYDQASLEYDAIVTEKIALMRIGMPYEDVSEILDIHTHYMRILANLLRTGATH